MKAASALAVATLFAPLLFACEEEKIIQGSGRGPASAGGSGLAAPSAEAPARRPIEEADFVENDQSRDPFRSYARMFAEELEDRGSTQLDVILPDYSIDELRLIGIVTRLEPARAMVVDPSGKGHVIRRGQFIGRPDLMRREGTTGATYQVNWRVDRIREGDVVLVREDPTNPDVPAVSRVLPLRTETGSENK
jgi:type IV pilus assembly protein PilP